MSTHEDRLSQVVRDCSTTARSILSMPMERLSDAIRDCSNDTPSILITTRELSDIALGIDVTEDKGDSVSDHELMLLPKDGYQYRMRVNGYLRALVRERLQQVMEGKEYVTEVVAGPLLMIVHTQWYVARYEVAALVKLLLELYRQIEAAFVGCGTNTTRALLRSLGN